MERRCRKLSELGLRFYVCPGSSAWCSFIGHFMNAVRNITTYAELTKTVGAEGFLMTEWENLSNAQFRAVAAEKLPAGHGALCGQSAQAALRKSLISTIDSSIINY